MRKTAGHKVLKECSARPSKPAKRLMSDEYSLGDTDYDTTFTTFRMTTTTYYHRAYQPTIPTLLFHVAHWLGHLTGSTSC